MWFYTLKYNKKRNHEKVNNKIKIISKKKWKISKNKILISKEGSVKKKSKGKFLGARNYRF